MMNFDEVVDGLVGKGKPDAAGKGDNGSSEVKSKAWDLIDKAMQMLSGEGLDAMKEIQKYMADSSSGEEGPSDQADQGSETDEGDAAAGDSADAPDMPMGGSSGPKKEIIIAMLKKKKASRE